MNLRVYVVRNPESLGCSDTGDVLLGQFCVYPCDDPAAQAIENGFPPNRTSPAPNPNAPIFSNANVKLAKRGAPSHAGEDLLDPPYTINNAQGVLSDRTAYVGLSMMTYDTRLMNE